MKYVRKQVFFFILYLAAGAALTAAVLLWAPPEQKWNDVTGIVSGFLVTGVAGLALNLRLLKHPRKAETVAIMKTEERTCFLRMKIQSAVHTATVLLVCAGVFAAMIAGYREVSLALAAVLLAQVALYVGFGIYYGKKY